jgi:hypothetical protein
MNGRQLIIVVVVTFVVIVIWIVADILHTRPSIPLNPKLETLLSPINPNFDQKVISQIKEITPISEAEIATPIIVEPEETLDPITPIATQSATQEGILQ